MKKALMVWTIGGMVYAPFLLAASVTEAVDSAASVAAPDFSSILTSDAPSKTLPADALGETDSLSKLRGEDGMGDIKTPGKNEAQACLSLNDPKCLAVQTVYQGAANPPELTEDEKEDLIQDYENTIGQADDIVGDADRLVSTDIVCRTATTTIPGRSEIEVCEEGEVPSTGSCQTGWDMVKDLTILYRCHLQSEAESKTCRIEREAVTETLNRYRCKATPAETERRTCTVPVEVDVKKTYPYRCTVSVGTTFEKRCIETLKVNVIAPCTAPLETTVSLTPFKAVGYNATGEMLRMRLTQPCQKSFAPIAVRFGTRLIGQFTEPSQSFTAAYRLTFQFSIKESEKEGLPGYEITVTNIDAGKGTATVTAFLQSLSSDVQTIDRWESVCP